MARTSNQRRTERLKKAGAPPPSDGEPAPCPQHGVAEDNAPAKTERDKICDDEFARYNKERDALTKTELEAEKNYDTLLVTLSTSVMGASYVLIKDASKFPAWTFRMVVASWVLLGGCLFLSLTDRLLTYISHQKFRECLDTEFNEWSEGAMQRAVAKFDAIRWPNVLPPLKWVCFGTFVAGVGLLIPALLWSLRAPVANQPQQPIVVYLNGTAPPLAGVAGSQETASSPPKGDSMSKQPPRATPPAVPTPPTRPAPVVDTRPAPPLDIGAGKPIPPAAPKPVDLSPKPNK